MTSLDPTDPSHYRRQLEVVCNNATVALFILDERQQCIYMNPAAEELTGYMLPEVQGKALHDLIHHTRPDGSPYPLEECPIDRAFPQNNREQGEEVFVHRDGRFYPVEFTASPVREAGAIVGTVIEVRDVSRERQVNEELRRSSERFEIVSRATNDAIWDWDTRTDDVWWNQGVSTLFGYAPQEVGKDAAWWYEQIHPEDRERVVTDIHAVIDHGGSAWSAEYRFRRADGSYADVFDRGYAIHDAAGNTLRLVGAMQDVTFRRQVEQALRHSHERFRVAVQAVGDILWTNNAEGQMEGEQSGWAAFTGQTQAEYQGYGWANAVHPDDAQPSIAAWNQAVAERRMFAFEHRVRRRDGVWRLFAIRALPVLKGDGSIREWVGVHTDITERREAERERLELLEAEQQARSAAEQERQAALALTEELNGERQKQERANQELSARTEELRLQQERLQSVTRYLRSATRCAAQIAALDEREAIAQTVVDTLVGQFAASVAGLWLSGPRSGWMRQAAAAGLPSEGVFGLEVEVEIALSASKLGWVARRRRPFITNDLSGDRQLDPAWLRQKKLTAGAFVPIVGQEGLHGVLTVFAAEALPLEVGEVLATIAGSVATRLDYLKLVQSLRETGAA